MKKQGNTPFGVVMLVVIVILSLGVGCDERQDMQKGSITIAFEEAACAGTRNIAIEGSAPLEITSYKISATGPNGIELEEISTTNHIVTLSQLLVGDWTFSATAYNQQNKPLVSGSIDVHIFSGSNSISLPLDTLVGNGTLAVDFSWNAQQTCLGSVLTMKIIDSAGNEVPGSVTTTNIEEGTGSISATLPAGNYTLSASLSTQGTLISGYAETFRIVDQTTSSGSKTLIIGKVVDGVSVTILNEIINPIEGSISSNPVTPVAGEAATLTCSVSLPQGITNEDLLIQWYKEGIPIAGAHSLSYTINSVEPGTYRYDVVISVPIQGSVGSTGILVSVQPVPSLT